MTRAEMDITGYGRVSSHLLSDYLNGRRHGGGRCGCWSHCPAAGRHGGGRRHRCARGGRRRRSTGSIDASSSTSSTSCRDRLLLLLLRRRLLRRVLLRRHVRLEPHRVAVETDLDVRPAVRWPLAILLASAEGQAFAPSRRAFVAAIVRLLFVVNCREPPGCAPSHL